MGCCTACAVKVKSGELRQVEALGVSQELRDAGYGLMCVAFPVGDCELELADEDEVYELQFGRCGTVVCAWRPANWVAKRSAGRSRVAALAAHNLAACCAASGRSWCTTTVPSPVNPCPRAFEEQATDPNGAFIERDDFALEIAQMDE